MLHKAFRDITKSRIFVVVLDDLLGLYWPSELAPLPITVYAGDYCSIYREA